jgi:microcystin-dependent protein
MSVDFLGAVMIFAGDFAPKGYALTQGQLLPIQQNTALFSLLGTFYGGDGIRTFGLPDLCSRLPIGQGTGAGLTPRVIGETGGLENVTLLSTNVPPHNHVFNATTAPTSTKIPGTTTLLGQLQSADGTFYSPVQTTSQTVALSPGAIGFAGGNQGHNNIQPSAAITYCMALVGIFPSRG